MASKTTTPQARRTFLLSFAGISLVLASCQMGPRRPVAPIPEPVEPAPTGLNYNGVAVIVPLTGPDGPVGTSISNAAKLALHDTREQSVRITVYDSAAGGAAAAAAKAIADGNRLILGPLLAEDVRAAAPVARQSNVPIIAFSNDEAVAGNGVYILGFTPDQSISRVVAYARSKGMSRFGALVPTGLYGQRATEALLSAVRKSGGSVAAIESYDRRQAAITAAARRLNARGQMDAVLIGDTSQMAALASPILKAGPRRLGTELWGTDRSLGRSTALRGAWFAAAPDAQFDKLVARYRARYGKTPYRLASLGYDAALLAVRSARNWPVGRAFPARTLIDKDGFAGVDGNFRFARDGIAERLLEVREVSPAGSTVISPAATAF